MVRHGGSDMVQAVKGLTQRRLYKAFLRYHDPDNRPVLREALQRMGRGDLIGSREDQLVPERQPAWWRGAAGAARRWDAAFYNEGRAVSGTEMNVSYATRVS